MTAMTTAQQIEDLMIKKFNIDVVDGADSASLDELGIDSLVIVELLLEIEKLTGIRIPEGELLPGHTVSDVISVVSEKTAS